MEKVPLLKVGLKIYFRSAEQMDIAVRLTPKMLLKYISLIPPHLEFVQIEIITKFFFGHTNHTCSV